MTETTELSSAVELSSSAAGSSTAAPTKSSGLAGLKLAQLQALASQLGISGGSRMRKGDLVTAISAHRAGTPVSKAPAKAPAKAAEKATENHTAPAAAPVAASETAEAPAAEGTRARGRGRSRRAVSDGVVAAAATEAPAAPAIETPAAAPAESGEAAEGAGERRQPRTRNRRRGEAAAAPQAAEAAEAPAEQAVVEQRTSEQRTSEQRSEAALVHVTAVERRTQVRLRLVEAPQGVSQEGDELRLCASAESFGHVGHDRLRGIIDLHNQPLIESKWSFARAAKNLDRPFPSPLPEKKLGERSRCGHGWGRELRRVAVEDSLPISSTQPSTKYLGRRAL